MAPPDADSRIPTVAVITVSYESASVLPRFLESVSVAFTDPPLVVVADNKCEDEVRGITEASGAEYLPLAQNPGYGGAINAAAEHLPASVEWILVSNPDVVLHAGAIDRLLSAAASSESIGSVGPAIYNAVGTLYPSARAVPSLTTGIGHALFANIWAANPWTRSYRKDRVTDGVQRDAGWLSGACVLVRRRAFTQIDGFDDSFFMYFEDVDLGFRLGRAGWRNVYEPAAAVTHLGAHSTAKHSGAMTRAHHSSAKLFIAKKYDGALLWPVRVVLGIGLDLRSWVERRRPIG